MKRTKKIALIMMTVALMAVCFVFGASAERTVIAAGECGVNATYILYDDGELVIDGTGTIEENDYFWSNKSIVYLKINEGITAINGWAFHECSNLIQAELPNSITSIDSKAFIRCTSLESITLSENLTELKGTFYGCSSLKKINIPEGVEYLGNDTFAECSSLFEVVLPSSLEMIENKCFQSCYSLESINIPDSVEVIGEYAFMGCIKLKSIKLSKELTTISPGAFFMCSGLLEIILPENLTKVNTSIVYDCLNLKTITFLNRECTFEEQMGYSFPSQVWISGYIGSTAEKYAKENNYHFIPLDGENAGKVLNHKFPLDWSTVLVATCSAEGLKIKTCRTCGMSESETIEKIAHSYGDWKTVIEASCSVEGLKTKKCATCGISETETISKLAHSFSEWETIIEPDCTRKGVQTKECSACDKLEIKTINAYGHKYDEYYSIDIEATCITDGSKSRHCTICDAKTDITVIEATNEHRYIDITVTPNGDVQSYTVHVCAVCDYSYKDETETPEESEPEVPETPDEPENNEEEKPCDCNCHKGGITAFFFKLINFFAKLFDSSAKTCKCGAKH